VVHLFYNTLHVFKSVQGPHHNPWVIEVCIRSVIAYRERGIKRGMFWECGVPMGLQAPDLKLAGCSERGKGGIVLLRFSPPHCRGGGPFGGGGVHVDACVAVVHTEKGRSKGGDGFSNAVNEAARDGAQ
jgi:hypothetical protein